jgi:hypothetical protein
VPGVAGTSCAAPTASGIIATLNDLRLRAGKPTLGFLNPLLVRISVALKGEKRVSFDATDSPTCPQYQSGGSLYDVVSGCNAGCGEQGFCAQAGWDPVTGMGASVCVCVYVCVYVYVGVCVCVCVCVCVVCYLYLHLCVFLPSLGGSHTHQAHPTLHASRKSSERHA